MNTKNHKTFICLLLLTIFSSCSNNGKADPSTESDNKSLSIKIQVPTMDDAIKQVKTHIDRTVQKVTVPTFYYEMVTQKKPCDQLDVGCSDGRSGCPLWLPEGYGTGAPVLSPQRKISLYDQGPMGGYLFSPKRRMVGKPGIPRRR